MPEVDLLGAEHEIDEPAGQAVAVRRRLDGGDHGGDPAARLGRDLGRGVVERHLPGARDKGAGLGRHFAEALAGAAQEGAAADHQETEQAARLDLDAIISGTAVGGVGEFEAGAKAHQRPAAEIPAMLEPALADPVGRPFLPLQSDRTLAQPAEKAHRAVRLRNLLDRMLG